MFNRFKKAVNKMKVTDMFDRREHKISALFEILTNNKMFTTYEGCSFYGDVLYVFQRGEHYDVYFNRLHIHYICNEQTLGAEVFIMDKMTFDKDDSNEYKVGVWCSTKILTGDIKEDRAYTAGNWDGYVYETYMKVWDKANAVQNKTLNKFNTIFKNAV